MEFRWRITDKRMLERGVVHLTKDRQLPTLRRCLHGRKEGGMSDERHNLPSASGYSRLLNCPGSWRMEQPFPSTSTEDSRTGDRIHAWLAGELSDDGAKRRS